MRKETDEKELARLKIDFGELGIWMYQEGLMDKYTEAKREVNIFIWDDEVAWYKEMIKLMTEKLEEGMSYGAKSNNF